ncbi:MAG TPA: DUF6473 family protein [Rhizomicrobium sp.]|nr:DUF6473 family protein [Rhizomicrobium sp.]
MYQEPDAPYIDYRQYRFGARRIVVRGPEEPVTQPYIVCLGAAQTFGRFVDIPYPQLLQERLRVRCINLGVAGGGPELFLADEDVLALCAGAKACVLQVMSGRSVSNAFYQVEPRRNAIITSFSDELKNVIADLRRKKKKLFAHDVLVKISETQDEAVTKRVFDDVRRAWIDTTLQLLERISTHRILFWFSEREPGAGDTYLHGHVLMKYPQLVDRDMIRSVRHQADDYVACVASAGMPQSLLRDGSPVLFRPNGAPRLENTYYPSPEMHEAAADALSEPLRRVLG